VITRDSWDKEEQRRSQILLK